MLAAAGSLVSLIHNRAALMQATEVAGFTEVESLARPRPQRAVCTGDRAVMLAWPQLRAESVLDRSSSTPSSMRTHHRWDYDD
jgi:hypothetical protein